MPAAAGEAAPVVMDELVVISEGRLRQEWSEGIGEDRAVNEQYRLSCTPHLVFQLPALDRNAIRHVILLRLVPRLRANPVGQRAGAQHCAPADRKGPAGFAIRSPGYHGDQLGGRDHRV